MPLTHSYRGNSRGLGVTDLAWALRVGRLHQANGALAMHVLDVMRAVQESSETGTSLALTTGDIQPRPLPAGLQEGTRFS